MREVVSLPVSGQVIWGTRHLPLGTPRDVGVLFFNGGQVPRAGHGGLFARAGDRLARAGMPVFRFDLPGLGDTFGELPAQTHAFWRSVEEGQQVPIALAVADAVKRAFGIKRLIAGGLCGGAVNAIYIADRRPALLDGLLLLEPGFFLTPLAGEEPEGQLGPGRLVKKLFSRRSWVRVVSGESRFGRHLFARRYLLRLLMRRATLPENVNLPLALSWARVVDRGIPCLILTASGRIREVYTEQIKRAVLGRHMMANVRHISLGETNHILTSGGASQRCADEMARWLEETFPPPTQERAA